MSYYIIIRGPAGSGKTTIARLLARELGAYYVGFDKILAKHSLDIIKGDGISTENFIKGNELILSNIRKKLEANRIVVIEACFYRKGHLHHLIKSLPFRHIIFSLKASLEECIRRNEKRRKNMTEKDIEDVFELVSKLDAGIPITTEGRKVNEIVMEMKKFLPQRSMEAVRIR